MRMFEKMRTVLQKRRQAYRAVFESPAGDIVMQDLRRFCRATSTPAVVSPVSGQVDPVATGIAIGRLEVWHRIAQHINISDADLYKFIENGDSDD